MKRWLSGILVIALLLPTLVVGAAAKLELSDTQGRSYSEDYDPATTAAPSNSGTRSDDIFEYTYSSTYKGWMVTKYKAVGENTSIKIPALFDDIDVVGIGTAESTTAVFGSTDTRLNTVIIPNSVKRIEDSAFTKSLITEITIPGGVEAIGKSAFAGCKSLGTLTFLDYVDDQGTLVKNRTTIGTSAFSECTALTGVILSNNVGSLGDSAFNGCFNLKSIVISEGVEKFESNTFAGCTNLRDIVFLSAHVDGLAKTTSGISYEKDGVVIHCMAGTDVYDALKGIRDEDKLAFELHTFSKNSYQAPSVSGATAPRCSAYQTKGTVGVSFNCGGYYKTVLVEEDEMIEMNKTDEDGNILKDADDKPIKIKVPSGNKIQVEKEVLQSCTHFSQSSAGTGGNSIYRGTQNVSMLWHIWEESEPMEPTCDKAGGTGGMRCKYCGETLKAPVKPTPALGHVYYEYETNAKGEEEQHLITKDGKEIYVPKPVRPINQETGKEVKVDDIKTWDALVEIMNPLVKDEENSKEATCQEFGWTAYTRHCVRCDKDIPQDDEGKSVPKGPHSYDKINGSWSAPVMLRVAGCEYFGMEVTHTECMVCHQQDDCAMCAAFEKAIKGMKMELKDVEKAEGWTAGFMPESNSGGGQGSGGTEEPPETFALGAGETRSLILFAEGDEEDEEDTPASPGSDEDENKAPEPDEVIIAYAKHLEDYHKETKPIGGQDFLAATYKYKEFPALGHLAAENTKPIEEKEAICAEAGYKIYEGFYCTRPANAGGCGNPPTNPRWISEKYTVTVAAPDHNWQPADEETIEEPTCTEPGEKRVGRYICVNENCPDRVDPEVPYEDPDRKGEIVKIDPLGHKWGSFVPDEGQDTTQAEDCHEKKITGTVSCEREGCGETGERTITIPGKLAHTWGEWVTTKEPTAAEPGTQKRTCKVCGEQEEKTVPAGGGASNPGTSDPGTSNPGTADPGTSKPDPNAEYTVTVTSGSGGTAGVSRTSAKAGTSVTVTVSPHSGFELDMIRIIAGGTSVINYSSLGGGRYSFTMPAANVTVTVSFDRIDSGSGWGGASNGAGGDPARSKDNTPVQITPQSIPRASAWGQIFSDIPTGHWAAGEINWANRMGYMNGTEGRFNPDEAITCQQMWMVLARLTGSYPANMADARRWAVEGGFADGSSPTAPVARHQLVTALYRCAYLKGGVSRSNASLAGYADSRVVPSAARDAFAWAVANGIVSGTSGNRLEPNGTLTRAQFAVILYRYSQRV